MDVGSGRTPTVCIVDDDPSVCRALTRLLRGNGFRTEAFSRPADFVERLKSEDTGCDALLLDIHLGTMNGFELHAWLTDMGFDIPTIFMTGRDGSGMREEALRVGGRAYLVKPFEDDALIAEVRAIFA